MTHSLVSVFLFHFIKASMFTVACFHAKIKKCKKKKIFLLMDGLDLGHVLSSAFEKPQQDSVWMPWQLMSQLACEWKLKQLPSAPHEKTYSKHQTEDPEWYSDHSERGSLWCYNAHRPPWHFCWKLKKNKAVQMSKGHRVLYNLYPSLSANSRTCNNNEVLYVSNKNWNVQIENFLS